jgi:rhomboid protease GluP
MSSIPPSNGSLNSHPDVEPEILRPAEGYIPTPQPMVRRRRSFWSSAPATYVLVGTNCAVFLAMLLHGVSALAPTPDQLMFWGANNAGSVLISDQWWRIVTAMFVHVGIIHLATNMWCLWNLGLLAEPLMGSFGVTAVYVLTGAAGNLLSVFWNARHLSVSLFDQQLQHQAFYPLNYFSPGAGASGAVFGIAGALIVLLKSPRLPVPPVELKRLRKSVIYFAAINLVIGLAISWDVVSSRTGISIDNSAHLGGVLCGLLFAAPMVPRLGNPQPVFRLRLQIAVGMIVGILVLFGFFITTVTA